MDYEELVWRVQNESASPDILQRSISHSPPNSGASTPEPFRRRQTPISPRSPRTLEPDMAHQGAHGVTLRHPRTASVNLRRSGTYDLLDHEYEDEKQLKRENGLKHWYSMNVNMYCEISKSIGIILLPVMMTWWFVYITWSSS